jgi:hypothetical protein
VALAFSPIRPPWPVSQARALIQGRVGKDVLSQARVPYHSLARNTVHPNGLCPQNQPNMRQILGDGLPPRMCESLPAGEKRTSCVSYHTP